MRQISTAHHRSRLPALASLLPLLAALVGVAVQAQPAGPDAPPALPQHAMHHRPGGPGAGMMGEMPPERLLDEAGATAEQKAKIRQIMKAAHADLRQQHDSGRKLHEELAAVLAAPKVDAAAAEGLRAKLQAQRDVASKRMLQATLEASAVLSPEQRKKMAERMKQRRDMMERHHKEREALDGPRS